MGLFDREQTFKYKKIFLKYWKQKDFKAVYGYLEENSFEYKLDTFEKLVKGLNENEIFNYLVYLISVQPSTKNVVFVCEYLLYINPTFYDIYSVIGMFLRYKLSFGIDKSLINWIFDIFEGSPDSPFSIEELNEMKKYK